MTDGVVIDACIIPDFYREYVSGGSTYELVIWISDNIGIAVNEHIVAEWKNVCSNDIFLSWYTDALKNGKIRNIPHGALPGKIKKDLNKLGFPLQSKDIHYIECACSTENTKYIITVNYDFYEPTCFSATKTYKNQVRELRKGCLCKYLKKNLGITVGMVEHCACDLGMNAKIT